MIFQAPMLLWWFVPVAAFIVLLYLLKIRRRTVKVPAVFLFPPITTDVRANALWQRWRFHWLMVLQLLSALLLVTALARPAVKGHGWQGQTVVFVLDASASMKAVDVKPSRFAEGKKRIARWLRDWRFNDQAALILAASEPRVVAPLSSDHTRLRKILDKVEATDAPADIATALRLAAALVKSRPNAVIVLVSDGSFAPVTDFSPGTAKLVYEAIGKSDRNAGWTVLDAQRKGNQTVLFMVLRNFSRQALKGTVSLFADGRLSTAKELTLPPNGVHGETVSLPPWVRQVAIRWECADDVLLSDDIVHFVGTGQRPLKVLLVGSGNFFLERALALEPECVVDKAPHVPETERGEGSDGRYDVVIFDGTPFTPAKAKAIWLIGVTDGNFVRKVGEVSLPTIVAWEREHPILRFVDLSAVLIDKGLKVRLSEWAQSLVDAKGTPLVAVGERDGKRWLFIGFNVLESDFPLRVGFPIFVANALRWSVRGKGEEQGFLVKAGSTFSLSVPTLKATLQFPDGRTETLRAPNHFLTLRATEQVGVYNLRAGNLQVQFAVNLLNADESTIAPKQVVTLGARPVAAHSPTESLRDLWWLALLLALLLLAVEWLVFLRWS